MTFRQRLNGHAALIAAIMVPSIGWAVSCGVTQRAIADLGDRVHDLQTQTQGYTDARLAVLKSYTDARIDLVVAKQEDMYHRMDRLEGLRHYGMHRKGGPVLIIPSVSWTDEQWQKEELVRWYTR